MAADDPPTIICYGKPVLVEDALQNKDGFTTRDCLAAIRGESVPRRLGVLAARRAVVSGIRHHPGFATVLHGTCGEFTRALNARSIMSDIIPDMDMDNPDEVPYCIWHPDIAKETTYRDLVIRYPALLYHVGRACAVAGYTSLYKELVEKWKLLPEVHIAEEARESGSMDIFNLIMTNELKYKVMNDYERTVSPLNPPFANLNGDTAVRAALDTRVELRKDYEPRYFNITEDANFSEESSGGGPIPEKVVQQLYLPLPRDLPVVDKDILIIMAAYYGDVDRYTRLRRPVAWWSVQDADWIQKYVYPHEERVWNAICARFIMNNDLSMVSTPRRGLSLYPAVIWFPTRATSPTYRELARRRPNLKPQAARACIVADYQATFDALDPDPDDRGLLLEARASPNPHYARALEEKIKETGKTLSDVENGYISEDLRYTRRNLFEPTTTFLNAALDLKYGVVRGSFEFVYEGQMANVAEVELFIMSNHPIWGQCQQDDAPVANNLLRELGQVGDRFGEDCLTVNVWSKPQSGEKAKAVIIWIYGGAFNAGRTSDPNYYGPRIADEHDVVVEKNTGLLDQRLAIEWARDNVAAFGGDPKRMILFGESGGAMSVDFYSYVYTEDPIVYGFIAESGTTGLMGVHPNNDAVWFQASEKLGCGGANDPKDAAVSCMKSKPYKDLLKAILAPGFAPIGQFIPSVDDKLVFSDTQQRLDSGRFIKKPLLTGGNNNEAGLFFGVPAWRYRYFGQFPNQHLADDSGAWHSSEIAMIFGTTERVSKAPNTPA
ncbi:alpha/beta-hydrolase [Aulographum hederae CBS 113979]|uniref:Alpha/beta-hydrolase n=1 Tax=Aulographum hederae CBS 113979 TaxID=1176131 RepID=A0A6G1GXJ7_9PEZI|nr:alpha/beta-hydrolase [Aulographum hederae CBS 113979]